MLRSRLLGVALFFALALSPTIAQTKLQTVAQRLGYPADAKLLIIHADDLAVSHAQDSASFTALDQHAASAASVMVPCPWLTEVAEYAKAHPSADLGLHLTLTSEWRSYRWGRRIAQRSVRPARSGWEFLAGCSICSEACHGGGSSDGNSRADRAGAEGRHSSDAPG